MYDCIVVGGSAAGTGAAIYLARRKLNFKMITSEFGGEVARSGDVDNYPGFVHTEGMALADEFKKQLQKNEVLIEEGVWVKKIIRSNDGSFLLETDKGTEQAKTVIISTGVHPRELNVPGEKEYRGKGVTYCTVCDGPLFKGKPVAIIGGGNSALEAGIMMASLSPQVYVLTINPQMQGEQVLIDKLQAAQNVTIIGSAQTQKIVGENLVSGLEYKDSKTGEIKKLDTKGVFIHIGFIPNSDLVDETLVLKNQFGNIKVDLLGRTKTSGLFAAGDVIDFPYQQIATSVGQGVTAALTCINYLNTLK